MNTLKLESNDTFSTEISVKESDPYTKMVYVKFDRVYVPEEIRGCDEMFLSLDEVESMGKFFLDCAKSIRFNQIDIIL